VHRYGKDRGLNGLQQRYFCFLFVGLAIYLLVGFFPNNTMVRGMENSLTQAYLILHADKPLPEDVKNPIRFAWIDMDEKTFEQWERPLYTPRDKLAGLIELAATNGSKAVVVDVDITRPGDQAAYKTLLDMLEGYNKRCLASKGSCAPIVLARPLRQKRHNAPVESEVVPPRLQKIVSSSDYIFWGDANFVRDSKKQVRFWKLWQPYCTADSTSEVMPSIELILLAFRQQKPAAEAYRELMHTLAPLAVTGCDGYADAPADQGTIQLPDATVRLVEDRASRRLLYPFSKDKAALDADGLPIVFRKSAAQALDQATTISEDSIFQDRITIIGGSHHESGDLHQTPLGEMAGSMLIINAVYALQIHGNLHQPHPLLCLTMELLLIALLCLIFVIFDMMVALLIILSSYFIIFLLFMQSGIWLNLAVSVPFIYLLEFLLELLEAGYAKEKVFDHKGNSARDRWRQIFTVTRHKEEECRATD